MEFPLTFFRNHRNDGILVNKFHGLHAAFIDGRYNVNTPHATLTVRRCVKQCRLEMSVEFRIKLSIVAEQDPDGFLGINAANFEVCAQCVLHKVAMI